MAVKMVKDGQKASILEEFRAVTYVQMKHHP
jgi:hypothetical protein